MAVGRGPPGAYDDRAVFTPEELAHSGKYYLVYQTVKAPYLNRVKNQVGMAIAGNPNGPFRKLDHPILSPADNGQWLGDEDNRFKVRKQGDFEIKSHIKRGPEAAGLVRSFDTDTSPLETLKRGLCHQHDPSWQWQWIRLFESDQPFNP